MMLKMITIRNGTKETKTSKIYCLGDEKTLLHYIQNPSKLAVLYVPTAVYIYASRSR